MAQRKKVKKINSVHPYRILAGLCMTGVICLVSFILYQQALRNPAYLGLPTVPCVDSTRPIMSNYQVLLTISVNGTNVPLDPSIGHDYGNCLRAIHTDNDTGVITISSNDPLVYTLGDFFTVWKKTFNAKQFMNYPIDTTHPLQIEVNGTIVTTYDTTALYPGSAVTITYM